MVYKVNIHVILEIGVSESISGDKFVTGSRINVLIAHAHVQTLSSPESPKMVSHPCSDSIFIGKFEYNFRF